MPQWIAWALGAFFVLLFATRDLMTVQGGIIDHAVFWGRDFINVWTGGHLVREGRFDVLYNLRAYAAYQRGLFGPIGPHDYCYPPVSYPLAAAFSLLPYYLSLTAWLGGTGALFVLAWPLVADEGWADLGGSTDPRGDRQHLGWPLRVPRRRPVPVRLDLAGRTSAPRRCLPA